MTEENRNPNNRVDAAIAISSIGVTADIGKLASGSLKLGRPRFPRSLSDDANELGRKLSGEGGGYSTGG
jgi:hypothetical protein